MEDEQFSENRQLLQTFTVHLVKPASPVVELVPQALLTAMLPLAESLLSSIGTESAGFQEVMTVMHTLALSGNGAGHLTLFQAATVWLQIW